MELMISEKPSAAKKIAEALADTKPVVEKNNGVTTYRLQHKGKDISIVAAAGHLYTVMEKKKSFVYPSYDIEWVPSFKAGKDNAFSKKFLDVIKKEAKKSKSFVVACDYDTEGEVIGYNIVRFACGQKDAARMKFSTLTKDELVQSYENRSPKLDWGLARAGETRHFLDWLYGINLSRALMTAIKNQGMFKVLSTGRVQGPALKIVADKEKEIKAFIPVPFWQVLFTGIKDKITIEAFYKEDKIWDKKTAETIYKKCKDKDAVIAKVTNRTYKQAPPNPFNLGDLQTEGYRNFGITPKQVLQIAQSLYLSGYTSYPRTSSQQIPSSINTKKILEDLKKNTEYTKLVSIIKKSTPNNGPKTDPAHPAIHPTGIKPTKLEGRDKKIYDLIVKRFLASFGEFAERESIKAELDIEKEIFILEGKRTIEKGWHTLYEPYVDLKEAQLPELKEKQIIKHKNLEFLEKETSPPRRYTQSSLVTELEKLGLGTKATRADIVDNLFNRGYVDGKSIEVTELGMQTVDVLHKYVPEILDVQLTHDIEEELEEIKSKHTGEEEVLTHAKNELDKILKKFKEQEKSIGKELLQAEKDTWEEMNTIGKCTECDGNLLIKKGKFGRFAACTNYPECKVTMKLPQSKIVKKTGKVCEHCSYPIVLNLHGKRMMPLCINPDCPTKAPADKDTIIEEKEISKGFVEKECPKCKNPLMLRKSVYGEFIGCTNFPKCRYTEKLTDGPHKEDFKK